GMGVVYMAEQIEPVRRRVALKIIKPGMDTKQVIARFEAERQALALMNHPHICKVFDGGTTESGRPYFVMELVRGMPITEFCDHQKLGTRDRLRLFLQVCQSVQHAHQKGIIHRDLKPSNVMVTLHDGVPVVKVIDFGVAKALNQQLTEKTLFTRYGQMIGTPQYMSPEQAEMSGLDVDTRSDIYSLGVLMYELLTGSTPLAGDRLRSAGYAEMQRLICQEDFVKPSTRLSTASNEELLELANRRAVAPRELPKQLRGDLDWIVMKALEKDRQRRYPTATDFAADVRRHLASDIVTARRPSLAYRLERWARRNVGLAATAALIGVIIVVAFVAISSSLLVARSQSRRSEALANELRKETIEGWKRQYLSDMSLGIKSWESNNVRQLGEILDRYREPKYGIDPRNFAWRYLSRLCDAGGDSRSRDLPYGSRRASVSSNSDRLAVALADGSTVVFDLDLDSETGWATNPRHFGAPHRELWVDHGVAFIDEGRTLICGDETGRSLTMHNLVDENQKPRYFCSHSHNIDSLAIFEPRQLVATATRAGEIYLWNYVTGELLDRAACATQRSLFLRFSPDGSQLLIVVGREAQLFAVTDSQLEVVATWEPQQECSVCLFVPQASQIVIGLENGDLAILDGQLQLQRTFPAHSDGIRCLSFSPDERSFVTSSRNNVIRIWEWPSCQLLRTLKGHSAGVMSAIFDSTGEYIISTSMDNTIRLWRLDDISLPSEVDLPTNIPADVERNTFISANSNSSTIVYATHESAIGFDTETGRNEILLAADESKPILGLFDDHLVISDADGKMRISNCMTTGAARTVNTSASEIPICVSSQGHYLVTTRDNGSPVVYDLQQGNTYSIDSRLVRIHYKQPACDISPDEKTLAFADAASKVKLYSLDSRRFLRELNGHAQGIASITFSPNGEQIATGTVRLWETSSGELLHIMRHSGWVDSVIFSPDGMTLASSSGDQTIRVWDGESGREVLTLNGFRHPRGLVFTRNGNTLVCTDSLSSRIHVFRAKH
ncbi:MAG: protein kinase, partial [Planctomycetales bacterium]|nr:protein kinase [Planctomycetales bacterium]